MSKIKNETAQLIFEATEKLIAEEGITRLSMQKIAQAANISVGTIYIYFPSKATLLSHLANHVFQRVSNAIGQDLPLEKSFFEQYRKIWLNFWHFLQENPTVYKNIHQYESLPDFHEIVSLFNDAKTNFWKDFCERAIEKKIMPNLPSNILFCLGLGMIPSLVSIVDTHEAKQVESFLEMMIKRSWISLIYHEDEDESYFLNKLENLCQH